MPKLLESLLEITEGTASTRARDDVEESCCKYAGAISVQHDCSFQSCDSYLDCALDRISILIVRVPDVRFVRSYNFSDTNGERAFIPQVLIPFSVCSTSFAAQIIRL